MYIVHYKKATKFEDLKLMRFESRAGAESATFDLPEDRNADVIGGEGDLVKKLWGQKELVALYNALGVLTNTTSAHQRFHDVPTARTHVMMRLHDAGKNLPLSPPGASDKEWEKRQHERDKQDATEMYLGATDDTVKKEAEAKLASLGVSVPSDERVEEHNMTAKTKKKAARKAKAPAAKKDGVKVSRSGEAFIELGTNYKPRADMTIGLFVRSLIMAGKTTDFILEKVQEAKKAGVDAFKGANTTRGNVTWYRGELKNKYNVKDVPSGRPPAAAK